MGRLARFAPALIVAAASTACTTPPADNGEIAPLELEPFAMSFPTTVWPQTLASGSAGEILLGGVFSGGVNFGGGVLTSEPEGSVFLAHLDADGDHLFSGATGADDAISSVAIGSGGQLYATGNFDGLINFGSGKLVGDRDAFFAAFTSDGRSDFSRRLGSQATDAFARVATGNGTFVLVGRLGDDVDAGGGAPSATYTHPQMVIVSHDAFGNYLWEQRIDSYAQLDQGLAVDPDGNVLVSGTSYDGVALGDLSGPPGRFAAKLDRNGKPLWLVSATTDEGGFPNGTDLAVGPDGSVYVSGIHYGGLTLGGMTVPGSEWFSQHLYFAKISASGQTQYLRSYAVDEYSRPPSLAVAPNGDLLVALTTYQPIDFGGGLIGDTTSDGNAVLLRFDSDGVHLRGVTLPGTGQLAFNDMAIDPGGMPLVLGQFSATVTIGETGLVAESGVNAFLARMDF